jgi:hypothetical protein
MYKKFIQSFLVVLIMVSLFKCAEESNPQLEADNFTSIFDHNQFDAGFTPIDIQQTADGGYVVLSERDLKDPDNKKIQLKGVYLMKADKYGNFESALEVGDSLMNPVGRLTVIADRFYFFCMENTASTANPARVKLASFDANLSDFKTETISELLYPAASSFATSPNRFILLSFNNDSKESVISLISPDGNILDSKGYTVGVGDKSEEPIMNHYLRTGRQFPFDAGFVSGSTYYFNGFYDYTFSLVFTDLDDAELPDGVVQGQDDDGGFSAVSASGGKFAAARFNYGDNYFLVNAPIQTSTVSSSTDANLTGHTLPELTPDAHVKILRATVDTEKLLIYGSDTQTRQIGLYFYNESGTFISSRYFGFSNPFEIANMIQTSDEGLAVCGTTYLAGRFPRICIFKISKEELAKNAK